jgi:hypothetical protein
MRLIIEKISAERVLVFRELTKYLTKYKMDNGGFVWKNKNEEWILYQDEQDLKNGDISINYCEIWSIFESKFNMNYEQIQEFTKERLWLDRKIRVNTTSNFRGVANLGLWLDRKIRVNTTVVQDCMAARLLWLDRKIRVNTTTAEQTDIDQEAVVR